MAATLPVPRSPAAAPADPAPALSFHHVAGDLVVTLVGELDLFVADQLRSATEVTLSWPRASVVVDCEHVSFCDVVGLRALLELCGGGAARGVRLRRPSAAVVWLLDITGTRESFTFEDSDPQDRRATAAAAAPARRGCTGASRVPRCDRTGCHEAQSGVGDPT